MKGIRFLLKANIVRLFNIPNLKSTNPSVQFSSINARIGDNGVSYIVNGAPFEF